MSVPLRTREVRLLTGVLDDRRPLVGRLAYVSLGALFEFLLCPPFLLVGHLLGVFCERSEFIRRLLLDADRSCVSVFPANTNITLQTLEAPTTCSETGR
ncbi:hypothetical protein [Halorussus caseinilyticus]|uniref:Uncharacterized protein n=1 Tax=Halorussus caseinilyticus TaxID=3034025 RepID=A0ABD5WFS3_9EURY|nr:hypothetical protein [Halorussus sp. DT72]